MNIDLLKKFFQGRASTEEAIKVINWIKSQQAENDIAKLFDDFDENLFDAAIDSQGLLDKLHDRINIEELIRSLDIHYKDNDSNITFKNRPPVGLKKNRFKKLRHISIYSLLILIVIISVYFIGNRLEYEDTKQISKKNNIIKKTEKGQKLIIHLSDGSKVTMNAATTIMYQENFNDSIRLIALSGEAFFEVRKDSLKPFLVKTGSVTTKALGTSFNVLYRPDIQLNEVALVTGKIKVDLLDQDKNESVVLNPGEMANLDYSSEKIIESNFDILQVTAWKEGIIYFNEAGYDKIVNTLENWYDVEIISIGEPKSKWKFSAQFENENLYTILDALKYAQNIKYKMENKTVKIYF